MLLYSLICAFAFADVNTLPGTKPLTLEGDLALQMVDGIDKFLTRQIEASTEKRSTHWKRDFSSPENYAKSVEPNRPVVVCQHGLEGRPQDVADPKVDNPSYHQFAAKLAERGFIAYAPQNPYIGGDKFRVLQRKANPLKKSLFSVIISQHKRLLGWLSTLDFVDSNRIAFYGLSYGGKTAMRVPSILEQYCLSICSADYNEWIWKNASARSRYSYLITGEYEMFEFDLGNTFNYAEMSWLICPRPFMVERGHHDGVAPDEWVSYEYAKTRRRYDLLGLGDRVEMEVFDGPHTINGVGTFDFLHKQLRWLKP